MVSGSFFSPHCPSSRAFVHVGVAHVMLEELDITQVCSVYVHCRLVEVVKDVVDLCVVHRKETPGWEFKILAAYAGLKPRKKMKPWLM